MSKPLPLSKGQVALVDDDAYKRLSKHKWCAMWNPDTHSFYAVRTVRYGKRKYDRKRTIFMHRVILNAQPGQQVDHVNHQTLDNRKANLRLCTRSENLRNQRVRVGGSSRHKGVYRQKQNHKWRAYIWFEGRSHHLGYFTDEAEAARAYDKAAKKYFGEFAQLNFPMKMKGSKLASIRI